MTLVALKCPNCNGEIQMDDAKEFGFCMYCGTKIIRESSDADKERNCVKLAMSELKAGENEKAARHAEEALVINTRNRQAWIVKGLVALDRAVDNGNYGPCIPPFSEAVGCGPDATSSFNAVCDAISGEFDVFMKRCMKHLNETGDSYYSRIALDLPKQESELISRIADESGEGLTIAAESHNAMRTGKSSGEHGKNMADLKAAIDDVDERSVLMPGQYGILCARTIGSATDKTACLEEIADHLMEHYGTVIGGSIKAEYSNQLYWIGNIRRCFGDSMNILGEECRKQDLDLDSCLRGLVSGKPTECGMIVESCRNISDWGQFVSAVQRGIGPLLLYSWIFEDMDVGGQCNKVLDIMNSKWKVSLRSMFGRDTSIPKDAEAFRTVVRELPDL